jgi:formate-dependent nitrite reductase membrane component NrfD
MSAAGATMPRAELRSYYGRPVIKAPVWKHEIPLYFFTGGLGGASSGLAWLAGRHGNDELARRAWLNAAAAIGVSPVLLIADLGRPARFLNMLRLFKVTSPMSVGSWILSASGLATTVAAADAFTPFVPERAGRAARVSAAVLGLPLATYTGALLADTAVPVWHDARATLPFVFGASAATTAGAAAVATTRPEAAAPARRLAVGGAVATAAALATMERGLGPLAEPYSTGAAGRLKRAAQVLTVAGAAVVAGLGRRGRAPAAVGGGLLLAGALCERWSIFRAGFQSAEDPKQVVVPQRAGIAAGDRRGATRRSADNRADDRAQDPPARRGT